MRRPKKDGWYEHAQNCSEYLMANFSRRRQAPKPSEPPAMQAPVRTPYAWMS
jgi:hypothetical protein